MRKLVFTILSFVFCFGLSAQNESLELDKNVAEKWLLAVDGDTVTAGDFWYVFNKNNFKKEAPTKASINEYLDLYKKFKLKVTEAGALGLDTTQAFKKELETYRKQLAQSYFSDKNVTEELVKEGYERMKIDVKASHILISTKFNGHPDDTMAAYKKAKMVLAKAKKGEDFSALAKQYSDDPSAKKNNGELGYFTVFKMVYPFETAAYNTKVGEVSELVRTRFGYHILKVHDKREAVGKIKVAHIMLVEKKEFNSEQKVMLRKRIEEIYSKLEAGEDFGSLARKYSEHRESAFKGGELDWFGPNKYVKEFEDAAFALEKNGSFSQPVKTPYGWHIIKRVDKKGIGSFEELENEIKRQVSRSDRAELSKDAVLNKIKAEYGFKEKRKRLNKIYKISDSTLVEGTWKIPASAKLKQWLFKFAGKKYTQKDFANYMVQNLTPRKGGSHIQLINYYYDKYVREICIQYEEEQLPVKHAEFNRLMKEYRDGIILFELTDEKVWSKAVKDTVGLKEYFAANVSKNSNWNWKSRVDAGVYKCDSKEVAEKVLALLKKNKDDVKILAKVNQNSGLHMRVDYGKYQVEDHPALDSTLFKVGLSGVIENNESFYVFNVREVIPAQPKDLEEIKGLVAAAYQDYLMGEWIKELESKYTLSVNEETLKLLYPKQ